MIARAAALRGSSVTEFVVASAQQAAADAIKDFELLNLHDEARRFCECNFASSGAQ